MTRTAKKIPATSPADSMAEEILKMKDLSVAELAAKYEELYGEPSRSRNHDYLYKRVAFKTQERAYGGLSERAKQRIAELAEAGLPKLRGKKSNEKVDEAGNGGDGNDKSHANRRDSRLPPAGRIITRTYEGETHKVRVVAGAFEYRGKTYKSLSGIAFEITGTHWNGYAFFGLKDKNNPDERKGQQIGK